MKTKSLLLVIAAILFALAARAQAQASSQNEKTAAMNALIQQANNAINAKNWQGAISPLQELLALDPTQWQYYAALGDAQRGLEEFDTAAESYEKGIHTAEADTAVDPRNPSTDPAKKKAGVAMMLTNQGNAYVKLHKNNEAFAAYMKAAALDPNPAAAYFNLCATAYNMGNMEGAHAACDKAIAADPSKADAYFINGVALFGGSATDKDGNVKAPPRTVEALKKYLALAPEGAHADDVKQMLEYIGSKVAVGSTIHTREGNVPSAQSTQKVIKDPAEYNDYITALNTSDPEKKAAAMEGFTRQYPQSVVLMDALEQTMEAYQQTGNGNKATETVRRILAMDPNRIRALALLTAMDRVVAAQGTVAPLKEGCADAETGLQQLPSWPKPEGMSDSEFGKLRDQTASIFNGMKGFCALQVKDFRAAREAYTKAFQIDPANLQDVYQFAVADLEMTPVDLNGLWYCGKAMTLAQQQNNTKGLQVIVAYCRPKYRRYNGGDDGFDQMVAGTAAENTPPPDFPSRITRGGTQPALEQQSSPSQ